MKNPTTTDDEKESEPDHEEPHDGGTHIRA